MNLAFKTSDRAKLWHLIEEKLYEHQQLGAPLRRASMTLCTGQDGWDDYLLLYHFDPQIELEDITEP